MTLPSVRPFGSMDQLVARLKSADSQTGLLTQLPASAQAHIAYDRILWFEGLDKSNLNLAQFTGLPMAKGEYHYIWIEVGQGDEIIVVGRTKFDPQSANRGDLFLPYRVHMDKSARAIAQVLYDDDDFITTIDQLFTAVQTKVNAYVKGAIVIPLNVAPQVDVHWLEALIGDAVVDEYGALNPNAHHLGRKTLVVAD